MRDEKIMQATCAVLIEQKIKGTAWLISNRGHLLTAGHVLGKSNPPETVEVKFSGDTHSLTARKIAWKYDEEKRIDFAVLQLETEIEDRYPLDIQLPKFVQGEFLLYGYGKSLVEMSSGKGPFIGVYNCNKDYLLKLDSKQTGEGGYSGSAVVSVDLQAAVAIQTQATDPDKVKNAERDTVLAMPLYRVAEHWDGLYKIVKKKEMPSCCDSELLYLFVDREKEKISLINIIAEYKSKTCLFEYTGNEGIGKTWLLQYFLYIVSVEKERYLIGYIDFKGYELSRSSYNVYPVLEKIAFSLTKKEENRIFFDSFKKEIKKYKQNEGENDESYLIESFKDCLNELPLSCKIVICFDNIDYADQYIIHELEDQLFAPLLHKENFILVFAGQKKRHWRNENIRKNIEYNQLNCLNEKDIKKLVQFFLDYNRLSFDSKNKERISKRIYQLTLGYPSLIKECLCVFINIFRCPLPFENKNEEEFCKDCLQILIDKVFKERIGKIELDQDAPSVETILPYLSLLRYIEPGVLKVILSHSFQDNFKNKKITYFEKIINEFQKKTDIFVNMYLGCLNVEDRVHNIFIRHFMVNKKNDFIKIQKVLVEKYDIWVKDSEGYLDLIKNVLERFYHTIFLAKAEGKDAAQEIEIILNKYSTYPLVKENFFNLVNALRNDKKINDMLDMSELLKYLDE